MINKFKSLFSRIYRRGLFYIYHFNLWHISSYHERDYAKSIVEYLNSEIIEDRSAIVEIGCGLADILRRVKFKNKKGLDMDENVLKAARYLSRKDPANYDFSSFSFPESILEGKHNIILMVNWIHHIPPEELKMKIEEYFLNNLEEKGQIIIDTVQDPKYRYNHSIDFLTSTISCKIFKIGDFQPQRKIFAITK